VVIFSRALPGVMSSGCEGAGFAANVAMCDEARLFGAATRHTETTPDKLLIW
jgi:hypothetical protein